MKPEKLKKWVYSYDKWGNYCIVPLALLVIFFIGWYVISFGSPLSSIKSTTIISLMLVAIWMILISTFWRGYVSIQGREYVDPYLWSLNKKKRRPHLLYIFSWFVAVSFLLNYTFLYKFPLPNILSYFVLIFSISFLLGFIILLLHFDKLKSIRIRKNKTLNVIYIVLSMAFLISTLVTIVKPDLLEIQTYVTQEKLVPGESYALGITLGAMDEYFLIIKFYRNGEREEVKIENFDFCEKKGHRIKSPFNSVGRTVFLYEYQFFGKYSPKIYCIEEIEK